jgi:hypothetical protein
MAKREVALPDPEADARVAAFFARMGLTWKPPNQA